ncbi:MAG: hypothetical protein ACFFCQ_05060 [Promethearchaeota archaeon]
MIEIAKQYRRIETDDIGSFPLPSGISKKACHSAAMLFHKAWLKGLKFDEIEKNRYIKSNFIEPLIQTFMLKQATGLDYPNYPQFRDMNTQFLALLNDSLSIAPEEAIIPEIEVLHEFAERKYEEKGEKTSLQVCITGPIELAIAKFEPSVVSDELIVQLALVVAEFVSNSVKKTEFLETAIISIDEPRLGLVDLPMLSDDGIIHALNIVTKECASTRGLIHLHSFSKAALVAEVKYINIIAGEFASDPNNYVFVDQTLFRKSHKKLRAGIAISSFDSLLNRYYEAKGVDKHILKSPEALMKTLEPVKTIHSRLKKVLKDFGDIVVLVGPDCGLGGWIFPEVAAQMLINIVDVVQKVNKDYKSL